MTDHGGSAIPLTTQSLLDRLESTILTRTWVAGQRLPSERQLADDFGVSRPVVRESLRRLQERGLIVVHPGRGSFVTEINPTRGGASAEQLVHLGDVTFRHLIAARRMLESEAAAQAADHRTDADLVRMYEILDALDSVSIADNMEVCAGLDVAFHEAIAVASGNPVIQLMFGNIRRLVVGMVYRSMTDRALRQHGVPIHRHVLNAVKDRDATAARKAMADHLDLAWEQYGADLDRPVASVLDRRAEDLPELADLLRRVGRSLAEPR
ncbi:MAG TPA: FadR/GntR family transcriptional regulator [Candidatus Lumbricidophila sp.]|nr:FadR/GntR family transcriptional regulator [Candidatus Lumbricidophila sp.]